MYDCLDTFTLPADSALTSLIWEKMLTPPPSWPLMPGSTVLQCFYRDELDRLEGDPTVETG